MEVVEYVVIQCCVERDTTSEAYVQVTKCAGIPCSPPASHSICLQGLSTQKPLSVFPSHQRKRFSKKEEKTSSFSVVVIGAS